jgi:hypothetical protein
MATEVVHTVGSGGDYADLAAWSAAQARNLVSANEIAVAEIVGTLTEPSYVPISTSAGWSTDSTRRIVIRAAAPFNGTLGAGSKLVLGSISSYGMAFSAALHVSIENLEVEYTGTSRAVNGGVLRISGCFIYGSSITDPNVLLLCDSAELNSSVFQSSARGFDARNVTATVDNCGFFALSGFSTYGLLTDSGTTVRNTVSAGWSDADIYGTPGTDSNNATLDGSVGATISTATGVDFVDYGSGDYTPTATGALFKAGTNPLSPLSNPDDWNDITGKTRAYWDIGAFAAPASLAENTHLATFTTRPTDTGASGGPNVAGTETNYPGYIDLSEAPQALWDAVTSGGGDIRVFENQAGGLVELPAEVVSCDTSAETGELHYLLPSISASTPQEIRLYADGVSSRYDHADPFGRNAVWGDYAFVLHTESDATDSTGNLSVTEEGTPSYTAGKLGGGAALTNAGFNFSNDTSPYSLGSGYWLSWWGDFNNFSPWGNLIRFASISSGGATGAISLGRAGTTSNLYLQHDTSSVGNVFSGGVSNFIASEEHYYGLRWDGSTAGLYRDATENYSRSEAVAPDMSHANFNRMFWETSSTNSDWNYVDEIRIRNGDPGANWITTEYNNQSDPSSFYTATDPNAGGYRRHGSLYVYCAACDHWGFKPN